MLLRKAIRRTKNFFHKAIQNLKSVLGEEYKNLPRAPPFNPFPCSRGSSMRIHQLDHCCSDFLNLGDLEQRQARKRRKRSSMPSEEPVTDGDGSAGGFMNSGERDLMQNKQKAKRNQEKTAGTARRGRGGEPSSRGGLNTGGYVLARKMKELEKMNGSDMDQVLDIEEVLHYYSRLRSPVYVDIVNQFFSDMYSDFLHPQAPASIEGSRPRRQQSRPSL